MLGSNFDNLWTKGSVRKQSLPCATMTEVSVGYEIKPPAVGHTATGKLRTVCASALIRETGTCH